MVPDPNVPAKLIGALAVLATGGSIVSFGIVALWYRDFAPESELVEGPAFKLYYALSALFYGSIVSMATIIPSMLDGVWQRIAFFVRTVAQFVTAAAAVVVVFMTWGDGCSRIVQDFVHKESDVHPGLAAIVRLAEVEVETVPESRKCLLCEKWAMPFRAVNSFVLACAGAALVVCVGAAWE